MPLALLLAAGAGAWLYAPVLGGLARQWLDDPAASYGLLLAAAAVFVAVRRLRAVRATVVQPALSGLAIVVAAMAIYLLGTLMGELFVQRASLPIAVGGTILAVAGRAHLRLLFPAVVLLALSIPLPAVIVTRVTLPMQLVASGIAADVLSASQIHVVRYGNLLVLDAITLEVVEACNGLRSLLSLFAIVAVCGAVFPIGRWRTMLLIAAVLPVGIVGNGVRIAATGVLATWFGPAWARGTIHELTGLVAFVAMGAAVLALVPLTRRWHLPLRPAKSRPAAVLS
jgi:exosortase